MWGGRKLDKALGSWYHVDMLREGMAQGQMMFAFTEVP
jgi:hypothetical protein